MSVNVLVDLFQGTIQALHSHVQQEVDNHERFPFGQPIPYRVWATPSFDVWVYLYGHENEEMPMPQWAVDFLHLQKPDYCTCTKTTPPSPAERRAKLRIVE